MARPKAMPPPSPSSSASLSENATSSGDDEEGQQERQQKEAARTKAIPSPVKKKPVVVPKRERNMLPQERMDPPPAKKKSVHKNDKKAPPPEPRSTAAAAEAFSSDEEGSDSPPKAKPTPSSSETSASSDDDEEGQQERQPKEAARTKASPSPVKKRLIVVPKQERNMLPQERKPSAKKKSVRKNDKKAPPPDPRSTAAAAEAFSSDEEESDSPPKAKPTPSFSRPGNLKPSISTEPTTATGMEAPTPAAASQQSYKSKERKRQREEAGDKQEDDAVSVGLSSSKRPFQRLWTEENEISLLEGMLEFRKTHGGPFPRVLSNSSLEFISSTFQGKFSKVQLYSKIRGLKKKYETNLRGKKNAGTSFAKPHEQVLFELSGKLWPAAEGDAHDFVANGTSVNHTDRGTKTGRERAGPLYPSLREAINLLGKEDDNSFLAQAASTAFESVKSQKLKTLEDRWSKHFLAGVNYFMERARLKKDLLQSLVGMIDSE